MKIQKEWLTVHFKEGKANIAVDMNYITKSFNLSHGHNDQNVTFTNEDKLEVLFDRAKCVNAALKFIKLELYGI
jgi:hypothetical protein